jgi:uncharacterized protein DUF6603
MPEDQPLSTKDLFLLMIGLCKLKQPPDALLSAEKYWRDNGSLRESDWNLAWFLSPEQAWNDVPHRDWLLANIVTNLTGGTQDFSAISEPMLASMDVLTNEFKPGMRKATDAIKDLLVSNGYNRSFLTTLSLGLSKQTSGRNEAFVLGAGMRRRTRVWKELTNEDVQADVEFFMPFYLLPGAVEDSRFPVRSISAGIAITRTDDRAIAKDENGRELAGVRFNFRIPFTARMTERYHRTDSELETFFYDPVIKVEKRNLMGRGVEPADWVDFDEWEDFVGTFCDSDAGGELLNAPIGPILLEKVSGKDGIKDLILKKSKRAEIKQDLKDVEKELDDTVELLKGLVKDWKVPDKNDPEDVTPHSSERKLGGLLESLGLLSGKGGEYTFKKPKDLTVWHVLNRLFDELDGFPLYIKGVDVKSDKGTRIAITLASQAHETDTTKHYFGLAGMAYNIPVKTVSDEDDAAKEEDPNTATIVLDKGSFTEDESILISHEEEEEEEEEQEEETPAPIETKPEAEEKEKKKSTLEIRLHLGKWFEGETLEDNWFRRLLPPVQLTEKAGWKRRVPLPGIRLMPFQRITDKSTGAAKYQLALRGDLLSLGFDFTGTTKDGLTFLKAKKGPLAYFGLGAVETRLALLFSADRVAFGVGIKLRDLRLSFGPKEKEEEKDEEGSGDDIIAGLQDLLADDWVVVPEPPKPKEITPRTGLYAKKKDKFSVSVGYLSPLSDGSHGTLDIQLYDEKGKRAGMVWIPIERRYRAVYVKHIGIGLKGVENVELSKGLPDSAKLTIALTGGLRFPIFELGFIGAKLSFPLTEPRKAEFSLDGLDVSLKLGPAVISGSFLRSGLQYGGSLTIELPKFSIGAMGFYGSVPVLDIPAGSQVVAALKAGLIHKDLLAELEEKKITPRATAPITRGFGIGEFDLHTDDGKRYILAEADGDLHVVSEDKSFFIYGVLSAATGGGVRIGPIEFTAIALGFGINRRVVVPGIEDVADFPLVKMVMGEGGYQEEDDSADIRNQLGEAIKDPVDVLEEMADSFPAEKDQYFVCAGVRFTIATTVDCFGLIIVQWGNDFEFALLGLARFKYPRDISAKPLCYIEMQILMSIKPGEGTFKLQALLTSNSWIINEDCKVTGGFAVFVWFAGDHKDDFVITQGGYHPRFRRPDHYPIVPRLGLNWPVNESLSIKGGIYMAVTPSCFMLGAKLEATFHSGRISAWYTAHLDVVVAWSPFHFEAEMGISLRVEAAFAMTSLKVTISATLEMWGPPVGGIARVNLTVISFDVEFGTPRKLINLDLIKTWEEFCRSFLKASGELLDAADKPVEGPVFIQMNLVSGRNNINNPPMAAEELEASPPDAEPEISIWKVRGDELELAASTAVPVTSLNVGKISNQPVGIQEPVWTGKSLMVPKAVALDASGMHARNYRGALGVHPMDKKLQSVLNVTIVRDDLSDRVDLTDWILEAETAALPAALWDPAKLELKPEPSAKLIPNCITGIKRLKPNVGGRGQRAALSKMIWKPLDSVRVPISGASQELPEATRPRNVQAEVAAKQAEQEKVVDALAAAGFKLAWKPAKKDVRFRVLTEEPLAGAVANVSS